MKTDATRPLAALWQALSEVPGWPDAPLAVRLRRLWPLGLPLLGCLVLAVWIHAVREPHRRQVRIAHMELVTLEEETAQLQQEWSDQAAAEALAQAGAARAGLLESPAALQARLEAFTAATRELGWDASFQVYGLADDGAAPGAAHVVHAPATLRLQPRPGNPDMFNSLLAAFARLTGPENRFEITRAAIRAEASGVPGVEVNLRAACRPQHEKTPE